MSWILDFFQPESCILHPDNIAADTLLILQDKLKKSMAKVSGKQTVLSTAIDYLDQDYENIFRDYFEESIGRITEFSYHQNFTL